ncbi:arginine repressor [Ethanoligenens sp.]|uniref:arginine repressor n=1 Tax=Ethanoligenens sp. TaxID=2099655 RepID=UPI0039E94B61
MKQGRHEKILEFISTHEISTQDELLCLLRENGYPVTQATVSRDIKQLRLFKTLSGSGKYIYTAPKIENGELSSKFDILLEESVVKIDAVFNQVVIKCYSGLANAVCAAMDTMHFQGLVGTLAGDDTILVIMRTEEDAKSLCMSLEQKTHM